ncbi:MAG: hypothetical protein H0X24_11850 [Ktedonobacterales bacterium]|nr:hypothetical protein [Ktedonobacterales bacterium]
MAKLTKLQDAKDHAAGKGKSNHRNTVVIEFAKDGQYLYRVYFQSEIEKALHTSLFGWTFTLAGTYLWQSRLWNSARGYVDPATVSSPAAGEALISSEGGHRRKLGGRLIDRLCRIRRAV